MKGWQIFMHSLRQVTGNFRAALRISAVLYLAQVATGLLLVGQIGLMSESDMGDMIAAGEYPFGGIAITGLVSGVTSLWIAVAWHRFVLTGEMPGLLPPFHGDRIVGYFGKVILIGLIMILPLAITVMAFAALGFRPEDEGQSIGSDLAIRSIFLPVAFLALRLSTMLPGAALKPGVSVFEGWKATRGANIDFLVLAVIEGTVFFAIERLGTQIFGGISVLMIAWSALLNWLVVMVGVSILTTLYGHYIEERPLM